MFHILSLFLLSTQGNHYFQYSGTSDQLGLTVSLLLVFYTRHRRSATFNLTGHFLCDGFYCVLNFVLSNELESNSSKYRTSKRIRKAFQSLGYGYWKLCGTKTLQPTWYGNLWLRWIINFLCELCRGSMGSTWVKWIILVQNHQELM